MIVPTKGKYTWTLTYMVRFLIFDRRASTSACRSALWMCFSSSDMGSDDDRALRSAGAGDTGAAGEVALLETHRRRTRAMAYNRTARIRGGGPSLLTTEGRV